MDAQGTRRKPGRPATFDRQEALARAMDVFWARGYEGTTLEDLLTVMGGITPPSFYHAFGSKEALFREVITLYLSTVGNPVVQTLDAGATARESIGAALRLTAESYSQPGKPAGCMLVLGATNCAPANKGPQEYLRAIRQRAPEAIQQRLERAVAEGELSPDLDLPAIAGFYATVIHGLAVRAGDGASREMLLATADGAMGAWRTLTQTRRRKRVPQK